MPIKIKLHKRHITSQLGSKVTENHYINHSKSILFLVLLQIKKTSKQKNTHRYREQTSGCQGVGWGERIGSLGLSNYYI